MRIAIVDDHPVVTEGVAQVLRAEEDMEVVGTAPSCPEGVRLVEETRPDIVLVDLQMPGGGGLELVRRARHLGTDVRFVILTAYASRADVSAAVKEGVSGYVLKDALPD
ncbi:MAG: response regulator transcription factor, partial [Bacillota bacterium]